MGLGKCTFFKDHKINSFTLMGRKFVWGNADCEVFSMYCKVGSHLFILSTKQKEHFVKKEEKRICITFQCKMSI